MADTPSTGGLLAPRTAATYPDFVHPNELANGYANMAAQIQDAMSMPSRYPQSPFWGNGAGRYAYGTAPYGTPAYGNPAGRNAPWWVTGANGQAGQYPNPGTILGQVPQNPHTYPGPQVSAPQAPQQSGGLLGNPAASAFQQGGLVGVSPPINPATTQQELASLPRLNGNVIADGAMQPGNLTGQQMAGMRPADYISLWDSLGAVGRYNLLSGNSTAAQALLNSGHLTRYDVNRTLDDPFGTQPTYGSGQ